jgi:hypothetical protein
MRSAWRYRLKNTHRLRSADGISPESNLYPGKPDFRFYGNHGIHRTRLGDFYVGAEFFAIRHWVRLSDIAGRKSTSGREATTDKDRGDDSHECLLTSLCCYGPTSLGRGRV